MALEIPVDGEYLQDYPGSQIIMQIGIAQALELLVTHGCVKDKKQFAAWEKDPFQAFLNKGFRLLRPEGNLALCIYHHDNKFSLRTIPLTTLMEKAERYPKIDAWLKEHVADKPVALVPTIVAVPPEDKK